MNWFLYSNIFIPILLAIILNIIIFSYGWNKIYTKYKRNKLLPPGGIVGIIWMILFGLLGYVNYSLITMKNKTQITYLTSGFLILFIIFCLSYPFLTNGLQEKNAYLLNVLTLILSIILFIMVYTQSKTISYYLIPLLLWALYVNVIYL
jgi:tryptophan-rich sensory protein